MCPVVYVTWVFISGKSYMYLPSILVAVIFLFYQWKVENSKLYETSYLTKRVLSPIDRCTPWRSWKIWINSCSEYVQLGVCVYLADRAHDKNEGEQRRQCGCIYTSVRHNTLK